MVAKSETEASALPGALLSGGFDRGRADRMKPLYLLPHDSLADEVLIEGFRLASDARCMVGFFSSAVLATLAPGLATFINTSEQPFQLIVSPFLSAEDQRAIEMGIQHEELATRVLERILITEETL